jgi:hypothetical protein
MKFSLPCSSANNGRTLHGTGTYVRGVTRFDITRAPKKAGAVSVSPSPSSPDEALLHALHENPRRSRGTDPDKCSARIQVKSRWATNYDRSFPIKNYDCDFVVHVALNRGYRFGRKPKVGDSGVKDPEFYIFPVALVKAALNPNSARGKTYIRNIPDVEQYKSA